MGHEQSVMPCDIEVRFVITRLFHTFLSFFRVFHSHNFDTDARTCFAGGMDKDTTMKFHSTFLFCTLHPQQSLNDYDNDTNRRGESIDHINGNWTGTTPFLEERERMDLTERNAKPSRPPNALIKMSIHLTNNETVEYRLFGTHFKGPFRTVKSNYHCYLLEHKPSVNPHLKAGVDSSAALSINCVVCQICSKTPLQQKTKVPPDICANVSTLTEHLNATTKGETLFKGWSTSKAFHAGIGAMEPDMIGADTSLREIMETRTDTANQIEFSSHITSMVVPYNHDDNSTFRRIQKQALDLWDVGSCVEVFRKYRQTKYSAFLMLIANGTFDMTSVDGVDEYLRLARTLCVVFCGISATPIPRRRQIGMAEGSCSRKGQSPRTWRLAAGTLTANPKFSERE